MAMINLNFSDKMAQLVLSGKKTATTRLRKKGHIGDTFRVDNKLYSITRIEIHPWDELQETWSFQQIADRDGFEYSLEYISYVESIYPVLLKDPTNFVVIHYFEYLDDIEVVKTINFVFRSCMDCPVLIRCHISDTSSKVIPQLCPLDDYKSIQSV